MKPTILVTGGTGYIGSHTVVELQNAGYKVVIIDNLSNSYIEVVDRIFEITKVRPDFEKLDLCDEYHVKLFFSQYKNISGIIHFAALKAVGESVNLPLKYYHNNINSLLNILSAMDEHKIENIVFSSSCTVYGQPDILPVTEKSPIKKAISPYGNTKQICEDIINDTIVSGVNMKAILLRYFNPIGAHESAKIGEFPLGIPNNLIPYITQTAAGWRDYLRVWGNDYHTPDGTAIRDYIHIEDLAKAHVVSIERLLKNTCKTKLEAFNVGTGKGASVMEIIKTFEQATGVNLNYKIHERRAGDIEQIWADTSFANAELGWKTQKTLAQALLSAWNWQKTLEKH